MAILVTGATGFIGSHVVRHLVNQGEEVVATDIVPSMRLIGDVKDKIKFVQGDLLDFPLMLKMIKDNGVRRVIHLAYSPIDVTTNNPYLGIKIDVIGMNNVFEAARILDLERVVWTSSTGVNGPASFYGGANAMVDEESPTRPGTIYGADKVLNEFVSNFYCQKYGLDFICLRPAHIYGPGKPIGRETKYLGVILNVLAENAVKGKPVDFPYPASVEFDWTYVKDLAGICVKSCGVKKPKHNLFVISSGAHSLGAAADYVKEMIPGARISFGNEPTLGWVNRFDNSRARQELGFEVKYPLREGLRDLIQSLQRG